MDRILLGMSGGVDSSAAAILLKSSGAYVYGATLDLFDSAPFEAKDAKSVCDKLNIEHEIIDMKELFAAEVIKNFIFEYESGRTPNPCIVCNKKIKFGAMLNEAKKRNCNKIATGHYARIKKLENRFLLQRAADIEKDQSYVLYTLTQEQLSNTVFPLGDLNKSQIREIAAQSGLINAKKPDSQDICFVPNGDYAGFIEYYTGKKYPKGNYEDINGNILGKHSGMIHYTIGQRKGLGIAMGHPVFVIEKDAHNNRIIIGEEDALFTKFVTVKNVNFIPFDILKSDIRATVKLRYRHQEQPAVLHQTANDTVLIEFDSPQRAPSPGQSAVFYSGDIVLGGGIITAEK